MTENKHESFLIAAQELFDEIEEAKIRFYNKVSGVPKAQQIPTVQSAPFIGKKWTHDKISWKEAVGNKGPFQIATRGANMNNTDFEELVNNLGEARNLGNKEGFYWLFDSGDAVGFKARSKASSG